MTMRGGGTSQCGQTVGRCLVIDTSKHLRRLLSVDAGSRTCWVEPGITLDVLNAGLRKGVPNTQRRRSQRTRSPFAGFPGETGLGR